MLISLVSVSSLRYSMLFIKVKKGPLVTFRNLFFAYYFWGFLITPEIFMSKISI